MRTVLALLLPSTFLAVSCVTGTLFVVVGWRARPVRYVGQMLLGVAAIGFAAVLLMPVDQWLLRPLEDRFPVPMLSRVDGLVVLGGAISERVTADRAMPSLNRDADRLVAFASLARLWPSARLVYAGGPPADAIQGRLSEADASRLLFEQLGLPPGRVLYDDKSQTTWGNALNALALANPKPGEIWLLVTTASHMPRAIGAFRAAGWPAIQAWPVAWRTISKGWPASLRPVGGRLEAIDLAAHEWIGLLDYWWRGRSGSLFPGP